jgi:hypothetical protein
MVSCDDYECSYYQLYASNFKRDINNVHQNALIEFVHGVEVYASLPLNLCNTWACCDAHKCCITSTSSQAICDGTSLQLRPHQTGSLIKHPPKCICKIPWHCEDNHKIGLFKKFVLKVQPIASTDELIQVHDHLLMVPSHKHYNLSKCVRNVDLVRQICNGTCCISYN